MKPLHVLFLFVGLVVFVAVNDLVLMRFVGRDQNPPVASTLVSTAKEYVRTLPAAYMAASQEIKAGRIRTKPELVKLLASHSQPIATALDNECARYLDSENKIVNPVGLSDMFEVVAKALEK